MLIQTKPRCLCGGASQAGPMLPPVGQPYYGGGRSDPLTAIRHKAPDRRCPIRWDEPRASPERRHSPAC